MEFNNVDIERFSGYSYISKYIYRDKTISLKAKGLMSLFFSLPDNWKYSEAGLAAINDDGIASVKSTIKELKEKKYLIVERKREANGRLGESCFKFYQIPYDIDRSSLKPDFIEYKTDNANTNVRIEDVPVSIMSNYHLRDKQLSLKAKGLLSLMFSLPPSWIFTEKSLTSLSSDGLSGVRAAIQELKDKKYLKVEQQRDNQGRLGKSMYWFFRMPYDINRSISPEVENPITENPNTVKPSLEISSQENPIQGKPSLENIGLIKTNQTKTNSNKYCSNKNYTNHPQKTASFQKNTIQSKQIEEDEVKKQVEKIKEAINYDSLIKYNALADQQFYDGQISEETHDLLHVNLRCLDAIIRTIAEVQCNSEETVKISQNVTCSKQDMLTRFGMLNFSDLKDLAKNLSKAEPKNKRRYILTMIYNYL